MLFSEFLIQIILGGVPMKNWTQWFDSAAERRAYIKAQRKEAKAQRKKLRVLRRSYVRQRCTGRVMYFAEFEVG